MKIKISFFLVISTVLVFTFCSKASKEEFSQIIDNGAIIANDTTNGSGGINGTGGVVGDSSSIKILFIGSSYFEFNNLPQIFSEISSNTSKNVFIDQSIVNGKFLNFHVSFKLTQDKIKQGYWDFVVLQGIGINVAYPNGYKNYLYNYPPHSPYIEQLYTQIKENNSKAVVLFCMPWAFEDGMTWVNGGTDNYQIMQQKIFGNTLTIKNNVGVSIAPVGWAFNQIMSEQPPLHYLFLSDYNHPSYRGSYLMACVIYASIFQESTKNIDYYGFIPEQEALHFQTTADLVVFRDFEMWNIPSIQPTQH